MEQTTASTAVYRINCLYQRRPQESQREDSAERWCAFAWDAVTSATRSNLTTDRRNGLKPAITSRGMASPGMNSTDMTISVRTVPACRPAGRAEFPQQLLLLRRSVRTPSVSETTTSGQTDL